MDQKKHSEPYFDPQFEFDAPKFFDFKNPVILENEVIESWFKNDLNNAILLTARKSVTPRSEPSNDKENLKALIKQHNDKVLKRKSYQIDKRDFLNCGIQINKKKLSCNINDSNLKRHSRFPPPSHKNSFLEINRQTIHNRKTFFMDEAKNSCLKEKNETNAIGKVLKERENRYRELKQTEERSQTSNRSKSNLNTIKVKSEVRKENKTVCTKRPLKYCPRIYDAKTMRKWELKTKTSFYKLSPNSRHRANLEIGSMIKKKEI